MYINNKYDKKHIILMNKNITLDVLIKNETHLNYNIDIALWKKVLKVHVPNRTY